MFRLGRKRICVRIGWQAEPVVQVKTQQTRNVGYAMRRLALNVFCEAQHQCFVKFVSTDTIQGKE